MAHDEAPVNRFVTKTIEIAESGVGAKSFAVSGGGLFVSGGALTYVGTGGTITQLGAT